MGIYRRGPTYWLDLRVRGKRIRKSLQTDERAVALARARDMELELRKPKPPGVPFAEFAEKYLAWAMTAKPGSYKTEAYRVAIVKAWLEREGLLTLEEISPHAVERLRAWVLDKRIGATDKRVGRASANRYLALLRVMFNKASDWGDYAGPNPVSRVKFYREGAKIRPLSWSEVEAMLKAVDTMAARKHATPLQREAPRLFRLILNTGLRRSEALGLKWADIGDNALSVRGKGGKVRSVPLNIQAREALRAATRRTEYVFDVPGRSSPSLMRRLTERIAAAIGRPFHLHLLRHKFASDLLAAGVDVVTISQLLGHSAYMTTLLYAHTNPALMREAVTKLVTRQTDARSQDG